MFRGLEHIAIASPDPERLANWYRDCLEFRINHSCDGAFFVRAANGAMIEIIRSEGARAPQSARDEGIRHLAIDVAEFDAAYRTLQQAGVRFQGEPYENQGNRVVFFLDADGNSLHLIQRPAPLP